ncbi:MAG: Crp/Fnr family transcriptional regulator, partial [Myxococcota bacterium]
SHTLYLDAGEFLYESGAPASRVFAVLEGTLQIEYPNPGEVRGRAVAILPAPSMLGECQVLHRQSWTGTGVALAPLTALAIAREVLEALVLQEPRFALALYRELSGRFLHAIESWRASPSHGPEQTLARYLVAYCEIAELERDIPLRQVTLGQATGLRRETVNRVLKRWEREGWVEVSPRGIRISCLERFRTHWLERGTPGPALKSELRAETA